jgi:hypothetical protein
MNGWGPRSQVPPEKRVRLPFMIALVPPRERENGQKKVSFISAPVIQCLDFAEVPVITTRASQLPPEFRLNARGVS